VRDYTPLLALLAQASSPADGIDFLSAIVMIAVYLWISGRN
jgi:hypothetical protein